jgi:hypothetical protein
MQARELTNHTLLQNLPLKLLTNTKPRTQFGIWLQGRAGLQA